MTRETREGAGSGLPGLMAQRGPEETLTRGTSEKETLDAQTHACSLSRKEVNVLFFFLVPLRIRIVGY